MNLSIKKSTKILLAFICSFIVADITENSLASFSELFAVIHMFAMSFLLFWWVREHADDNNKKPPWGAKFLSGLISFIGIPYYLYGTYGLKGGSNKLLIGIMAWLGIIAVYAYAVAPLLYS